MGQAYTIHDTIKALVQLYVKPIGNDCFTSFAHVVYKELEKVNLALFPTYLSGV